MSPQVASLWIDVVGVVSFFVIGLAVGYALGESHEAKRWAEFARPFKRVNGQKLYGPKSYRGEFYWVARDQDPCRRCALLPAVDPNNDMRH